MRSLLSGLLWLLISSTSYGLEYGCELQPSEIGEYGTQRIIQVQKNEKSLPGAIPIQTNVEYNFSSLTGSTTYGTMEGFFRPAEDDFISLIQLPVLGFDVSRDRIVVYICAHSNPDPQKSHFTVYFLRGYHMDPATFGNFWGNMINKPHMKIRPVPASILGIGSIKKFFYGILRYIPFSSIYFDGWSVIQRGLVNLLGDVTGVGIERVEITSEYIKFSSGINLASPREALFKKTFNLKKPELGPGATESESNQELLTPDSAEK